MLGTCKHLANETKLSNLNDLKKKMKIEVTCRVGVSNCTIIQQNRLYNGTSLRDPFAV